MAKKASNPADELDFEQALARLEAVVGQLEEGQIGLADAMAVYEEGVKRLRQCYAVLENAERRIELLTGIDADGNPLTRPYDEHEAASLEEKAASRSKKRNATSGGRPRVEPSADVDDDGRLF